MGRHELHEAGQWSTGPFSWFGSGGGRHAAELMCEDTDEFTVPVPTKRFESYERALEAAENTFPTHEIPRVVDWPTERDNRARVEADERRRATDVALRQPARRTPYDQGFLERVLRGLRNL